ncbi:MAG: hypothetical protein AB7N76_09625 [Planctomycetota bacterium]
MNRPLLKAEIAEAALQREVKLEVMDSGEVLLGLSDAARYLGISGKHLREQLHVRTSYLHALSEHVLDLSGGMGKPIWRIALRDLRAFARSCPRMGGAR